MISGWQESVPGRAFKQSATLALARAAPVPPASDGIGACHGIKVKTFLNAHSKKHLSEVEIRGSECSPVEGKSRQKHLETFLFGCNQGFRFEPQTAADSAMLKAPPSANAPGLLNAAQNLSRAFLVAKSLTLPINEHLFFTAVPSSTSKRLF